MSAHLSRPRLLQRHLRSLGWVWVWAWDWVHTPRHTLLSVSPPPLHTISLSLAFKFCRPLRRFPRSAKHSRRGREGFPAQKTGAGTQNWSPDFRGQPPGISRFTSKNCHISAGPPAGLRGPQSTHAEGVSVSPLRKRPPACPMRVLFFGVIPPKSDSLAPTPGKTRGPPPILAGGRKTLTPGA